MELFRRQELHQNNWRRNENFAQGILSTTQKIRFCNHLYLRFGKIHSFELLDQYRQFCGTHQFQFLEQFDVLEKAGQGATFYLTLL